MKLIILASLLLVIVLSDPVKISITIFFSILWFIYTIYYIIKLNKAKEKAIKTNNIRKNPPNNNYPAYIRFLYSKKLDYKVFISSIIELMIKGSISLIRYNKNDYYFIDNKVSDEKLSKSEEKLKRILFFNIGDNDKLSIKRLTYNAKHNSGFFYNIYKDWMHTFNYEATANKYYSSIKPTVDNGLFYFVSSMIIAIYNLFFTKYLILSLIIFVVTSYLIVTVDNSAKREEGAKEEYIEWLEFKNYLKDENNDMNLLDINTLETYATYAYVIDEYDNFTKILDKKYNTDNEIFKNSVLLSTMVLRIFDDLEKEIKDSIHIAEFKSIVLFARNKGRRL